MFEYNDEEKVINKVLRLNQDISNKMSENIEHENSQKKADSAIESSEKLLYELGYRDKVNQVHINAQESAKAYKITPEYSTTYEQLAWEANTLYTYDVELEDILTAMEINNVMDEVDEIHQKFSKKTSITNRVDLSFLAIAIALQVTKSLLFPYVAEKFDYGNSANLTERKLHDDKTIKKAERDAKDKFKKRFDKNQNGDWMNLLYQSVPYDTIKGSKTLDLGLSGMNHRLHTLGHDPILGWIFGTANILTDVITFNNLSSYRIQRNPMSITSEMVSLPQLFNESKEMIISDKLNLPAAVFAQALHLKSDIYTKQGLPIPVLTVFDESFASQLYNQNYDTLCLARDTKIVGSSFIISMVIDIIISIVHGLFREENESKELYEIRTRKILLISNSIASSSSVIASAITGNPKAADLGSLLSTTTHLFRDIRFITKIKKEFIDNAIDEKFREEYFELERIEKSLLNL